MSMASRPMPRAPRSRLLLIYESAEGGAGVLWRLVDEPNAMSEVARKALELLHLDPETGDDQSEGEDRCGRRSDQDLLPLFPRFLLSRSMTRLEMETTIISLRPTGLRFRDGLQGTSGDRVETERMVNLLDGVILLQVPYIV